CPPLPGPLPPPMTCRQGRLKMRAGGEGGVFRHIAFFSRLSGEREGSVTAANNGGDADLETGDTMGFWDFLKRIFLGPGPPGGGTAAPAPVSPPGSPVQQSAPGAPAAPIPGAVPAPPAAGHQASDYLPIARQQLLKEGEEAMRAGWMWFGRRDMI